MRASRERVDLHDFRTLLRNGSRQALGAHKGWHTTRLSNGKALSAAGSSKRRSMEHMPAAKATSLSKPTIIGTHRPIVTTAMRASFSTFARPSTPAHARFLAARFRRIPRQAVSRFCFRHHDVVRARLYESGNVRKNFREVDAGRSCREAGLPQLRLAETENMRT